MNDGSHDPESSIVTYKKFTYFMRTKHPSHFSWIFKLCEACGWEIASVLFCVPFNEIGTLLNKGCVYIKYKIMKKNYAIGLWEQINIDIKNSFSLFSTTEDIFLWLMKQKGNSKSVIR